MTNNCGFAGFLVKGSLFYVILNEVKDLGRRPRESSKMRFFAIAQNDKKPIFCRLLSLLTKNVDKDKKLIFFGSHPLT